MNDKKTYYLNFNTEQFLGGKELLKSMPTLYNRVYFCSKYGNALWYGEKEEYFSNIALLCKTEYINMIRQIIKNNFLYIADWDSLKFVEKGDYGFSFIGGNIKYIIIPFKETESGYHIMSYDADTGTCYDTDIVDDKKFFLDTSMNDSGEFIRTCDFNLENINDQNSKKFIAPKKIQPQMAVYESNRGYALTNMYVILLVMVLSVIVVYIAYYAIKYSFLG